MEKDPSSRAFAVAGIVAASSLLFPLVFWTIVFLYVIADEGHQLVVASARVQQAGASLVITPSSSYWSFQWVQLGLATLLGLLAALLVEAAKRPRLQISASDTVDHSPTGLLMRSVHVKVSHKKLLPGFRWFLTPSPATACRATLRFIDEKNREALAKGALDGRWTGSEQPSQFINFTGTIAPSVFEILKKRDIFPGAPESLDIAVRFQTDVNCYAFNNDNYVGPQGFKRLEHELPPGIYIVEVTITFAGRTTRRKVRLHNDSNWSAFTVKPLT